MKKYFLSLPILTLTLLIIYKVDNNAYIYAFLVLSSYCLAIAYLEKKEKLRMTFIYLGSILFALLIGEIYFSFKLDRFEREYDLVHGDDIIKSDQ